MVKRDGGKVAVLQEKISEVKQILEDIPKFIDRPEQHEYFQRKYGLDPKHKKDNRNLALTKTVTAAIDVYKRQIKKREENWDLQVRD